MCRMSGLRTFHTFLFIMLFLSIAQFINGCILWVLYLNKFASDEIASTIFSLLSGTLGILAFYMGYKTDDVDFRTNKTRQELIRELSLYLIGPIISEFLTALTCSMPAFIPEQSGKRSLPSHKPGAMMPRPTYTRKVYLMVLFVNVILALVAMGFICVVSMYSCCYANSREIMHADELIEMGSKPQITQRYTKVAGRFASTKSLVNYQ